jgi:hypothetical protein
VYVAANGVGTFTHEVVFFNTSPDSPQLTLEVVGSAVAQK